MAKVSATIVAKDVAKVLPDCLDSLKCIDEIVYLDCGSKDKSAKIAKRHGAKLVHYTGSDGRNDGIQMCENNWVLWLSADNIVMDGGIDIAHQITDIEGVDAFNCRVIESNNANWFLYPRLVRKDKCKFHGIVHEFIEPPLTVQLSDITILHKRGPWHDDLTTRHGVIEQLIKQEREDPQLSRWKYYLGREYFIQQDYIKSAYWFERCIEISRWQPEVADSFMNSARCYWLMGDRQKGIETAIKAVLANPQMKEAILLLSDMCNPKYKRRWIEFAKTATNEDVLFVLADEAANASIQKIESLLDASTTNQEQHS